MRVLRWAPTLVLAGAMLVLAGMFVAGGTTRMLSWYLTLGALPALGAIIAIGAVVRIAWTRALGPPRSMALIIGLIATVPASWALRLWPVPYPVALADAGPALEIRVPTDANMRVAWGGDSPASNQHAVTADQRWAYDLVVAPYFTGAKTLTDYGCFGLPVLAPIDGHVVVARDGEPDQTPGQMDAQQPLGNHVVIEPAQGGHLIIAHLKQGSGRVEAGQQVREGDPIGACGNSGNTSEPHVHIHYQKQHPNERPLNFADGLPLYFRNHDGPAMPKGGLRVEGERVIAQGDHVRHRGPSTGTALP